MRGTAGRRLAACAIDCFVALLWAGVLAAVTWPQRERSVLAALARHPVAENLVGFAALVLPVTVCLAWAEHRWGRTPGKRLTGLQVVGSRGRRSLSSRRALARNAVKIALPWSVGHGAVFLLVRQAAAPGALAMVLTALSYVLPLLFLVSVFVPRVHAAHDVVARTEVVAAR